ncbi:hypothetical protein [Falsirhodobacter sp. 20TX0035]|uniref:hypothetical protein n=1 Tax=Falsirhodobacter sp. 20TX0035 TaxID=3022019 RepID=UPI00232D4B1E|nr:hypothetical protein [Falsirhodobacter sp. 20TX0035]MDB6454722.1 hypothetical protein [Falsirhodobacter sp. 20TX0035]
MSTLVKMMDRFAPAVPDGHEHCMSYSDDRAFMFNRAGDLVSTKMRDGENDDTLRFRLLAAITAVEVQ